ncbi:MAG: hypothetical protein Q9218_003823, partial [Villophora microphyllina]
MLACSTPSDYLLFFAHGPYSSPFKVLTQCVGRQAGPPSPKHCGWRHQAHDPTKIFLLYAAQVEHVVLVVLPAGHYQLLPAPRLQITSRGEMDIDLGNIMSLAREIHEIRPVFVKGGYGSDAGHVPVPAPVVEVMTSLVVEG